MDINNYLTVAAYQGPIHEGDVKTNLNKILEVTNMAEQRHIDLLCFPETFLHGYFPNKELALQHSIDLHSVEFRKLCEQFSHFKHTTILLGLNEYENNKIYNSVVVIENGECIGVYRKAYSYVPYEYYSLGQQFPVFEKKGIKYSIIICLDSSYREPAHISALKGARIIFCPSCNRVQKDARMYNYVQRKSHFISRAYDNNCWLVVSDIVWDEKDDVCPGFACILNSDGEVVAKAEPFQEILITYSIPMTNLKERKMVRLLGNPDLFEIVKREYEQAKKNNET